MIRFNRLAALTGTTLILVGCTATDSEVQEKPDTRQWLAGDHHIHSRYSVGWDTEHNPPAPIIGGDAIYPTPTNALMARQFGLSWMVTTDHGGPNHSKVNIEMAYPELLQSRTEVPEVIQFYGMELNTPAGDHSSLIIPHTHDEADVLYRLESGFDKWEAFPPDLSRDTEDKMIEALGVMRDLDRPPVVIANHPSRSAPAYGEYGLYHPAEFRRWNDTAPQVAVGMAGAPGHQAIALSNSPMFENDQMRARGAYGGYPTLGGFDQMTAQLGGFWDSMLGEGRHWWITANSDSHQHFDEGGVDFWPGEYSKTYIYADKNHDSILSGLRAGHVFVTTGHLISELYVEVTQENHSASIGEEITVPTGSEVTITIRVRDPETPNPVGDYPKVNRVDLIVGRVTGVADDPATNSNSSTRVVKRFTSQDWEGHGEYMTMSETFTISSPHYIRVRGTNTDELEPLTDPPAENPWQDLWFYSNPVFIKTP
ncbi:MAG: phosphoesterase [Gammaproteobacteria bacterium]|nr:phosphoesterase [Gammaproteobacteria bacterium]